MHHPPPNSPRTQARKWSTYIFYKTYIHARFLITKLPLPPSLNNPPPTTPSAPIRRWKWKGGENEAFNFPLPPSPPAPGIALLASWKVEQKIKNKKNRKQSQNSIRADFLEKKKKKKKCHDLIKPWLTKGGRGGGTGKAREMRSDFAVLMPASDS